MLFKHKLQTLNQKAKRAKKIKNKKKTKKNNKRCCHFVYTCSKSLLALLQNLKADIVMTSAAAIALKQRWKLDC